MLQLVTTASSSRHYRRLLHKVKVGEFSPPRWLRNAHLQSILPSSAPLRRFTRRRARELLSVSRTHILECEDGVRLLGHHSTQAMAGHPPARHLAVLLHGWEGSAESIYVLSLGARLFAAGYDVFRLNFRDHGESHHLNVDLFHSCRLAEVVSAVKVIQRMAQSQRLSIAGFSLGGNFALRVAAQAAHADLKLNAAVAICPVLNPHRTMEALERAGLYQRYFVRKWKQSLLIKQRCFPEQYELSDILALSTLRAMTDVLVQRYSDFADLDAYLRGYAITGAALANLSTPSFVLAAVDDPIIPADDLTALAPSTYLQVTTTRYGGHCGYMERIGTHSWADCWAHARLDEAAVGTGSR